MRKWDRAKGKAAWAEVLQLFLTGNREACKEIMLDTPRGIVVPKGRNRRRHHALWVARRPVVPQALVGKAHGASVTLARAASPPAEGSPPWLDWGGAYPGSSSQRGPDLNHSAQFRDLCML